MNDKNIYRGYCLFNDIEDSNLRSRNRGVILANIAEDHSKNKRINQKGVSLIMGYYLCVPVNEREQAKEAFKKNMEARGYVAA